MNGHQTRFFLEGLNFVMAAAVVLLTIVALFIGVIVHRPFFDECVHAHYSWLISQGLSPHNDFWCVYPVLGYLTVQPLFRWLPETPYLLLVLRCFTAALLLGAGLILSLHARRVAQAWAWGFCPFALIILTPKLGDYFAEFSIDHLATLLAMGALVLMMEEPSVGSLAGAAVLGTTSVLVTPKYGWTLAPALLAFLLYSCRCRPPKWKTAGRFLLVSAATVGALSLACSAFGCSLFQNLYWAHLFMGRWMSTMEKCPIHLAQTLSVFLLKHWVLGLVLLGGIGGWSATAFRPPKAAAWTGTGIIFGIAVELVLLRKYHEQYLAPLVLSGAVFPPYLIVLIRRGFGKEALTLALVLFTFAAGIGQIGARARRFSGFDAARVNPLVESTREMGKDLEPGIEGLRMMGMILRWIPAGEKVVAIWEYHPIFRRDQTFITYDMGRGCSFQELISPRSPVRRYFDPGYFREELRRQPPAYICLEHLEVNYPPGWLEVCEEFLQRHPDLYRPIPGSGDRMYLRRDLWEKAPRIRY